MQCEFGPVLDFLDELFIVQVLNCKIRDSWDCLGSLVAQTTHFHCKEMWVQSVREPRYHVLCSVAKNKKRYQRKPSLGLRKEVQWL